MLYGGFIVGGNVGRPNLASSPALAFDRQPPGNAAAGRLVRHGPAPIQPNL